jgi:transposase
LIFARPLGPEEREALEQMMASDNVALQQRALIILLSSEEQYRVPEIAPMVGLHVDKVRKWITRFNEQGLKGLQPVYRRPGPRTKFGPEVRKEIIAIAKTSPRDLGQRRSAWTLDALRDYVLTHRVVDDISRESLRQILLRHNVDWQRVRPASATSSRWLKRWQASQYD